MKNEEVKIGELLSEFKTMSGVRSDKTSDETVSYALHNISMLF